MATNSNKLYWFYIVGFFIILALPLLALPPMFFPPEWGKTIVFRIVLSVILFLFLWQMLFNHKFFQQIIEVYKKQKNILWLLGGACLALILSTLFSSDITFSLWNSPHRSGGSVNFIFYILFSLVLLFILKNSDWKKLWNFVFVIGNFIVIFALAQYFNIFPDFLVSYGRPVSTLSNSILFALYLVLLTFPVLSFLIKEKGKKRFFYLSSLFLFVFGVLISGSRAAYFGLFTAGFYFFFFYPQKRFELSDKPYLKKIPILKIITVILLLLSIYAVYYINTASDFPAFLEKNKIFQSSIKPRLSINLFLNDPRFSAWQVAFKGLIEKPVLGWGPENFAIAFDKYYDPSLPYITKEWGSWWDKAHNVFFDFAVTYGLLFSAIYFSFFGLLFWKLHKLKSAEANADNNIEKTLITHGVQATFIGYFATLLFGFDSVSTYIMLFFVIGYSLHLTTRNGTQNNTNKTQKYIKNSRRSVFISVLFCVLIFFIWQYNVKPLTINAEINKAENLIEARNCEKGLKTLEDLFPKKSFLDAYLRLKYVDYIKTCAETEPRKELEYVKKGVEELKYVSKVRPNYTRAWLLLGSFNTILLVNEKNPENKANLLEKVEYYFNKAHQLGPKHQEILSEWAKTYFAVKNYLKMKEKAEECIGLNPDNNSCHWYLGLAEIALGNEKRGKEHLEIAKAKRFPFDNRSSLTQLAIVYSETQNYQELVSVYNSLIAIAPQNIQYRATLAFIYKELAEYKKARKEALKILEIAPEAKEDVDKFLKTLR